jgi:hypothetical protein
LNREAPYFGLVNRRQGGKVTVDKIYVDASQPAILRHPIGTFACLTLQEAVIAWDKLPDKAQATIQVTGGRVYTANEIERFHLRRDAA